MVNKVEYMKLLHSADLDNEPPKQSHDTRKRIWDAYTVAVCDAELICYKSRKEKTSNDPMPLVRYFTSSDTRQMFARLMVKSMINKSPISNVEIASQLVVTYKSVTTMIKECIDAGWIIETVPKLYMAAKELSDVFQDTYVKQRYTQTAELYRLRGLVTEFDWFLHYRTELALES